tara:strand:- start:494 stop:1258 length:765 start_codon:yes stop_codon:yes gene_type:complete
MNIFNNAIIIYNDLKKSYQDNYKLLITIISSFLLLFLIRSTLALLDTLFTIDEYPIQRILFMISSTLLIVGLEIGFTKIIFNALNLKKIFISNIFNYFHLLSKYIIGLLLFYGILIICSAPAVGYLYYQTEGNIISIVYNSVNDMYFQEMILSYLNLPTIIIISLLLVLPTLYISLRLFLWSYYVIDKEIDGYSAIQESIKKTQNIIPEILCYLMCIALFNILGLLSVVGICLTIPLSYIFLCKYYQLLSKQNG